MPHAPVVRALTALAALLSVGAFGTPAAASAETAEPPRTWSASVATVCVESHVAPGWGVEAAVRAWNRLKGAPDFVVKASCPDYAGTVTVRYERADTTFTGWTDWFWDETGYLVHADITLNPQRLGAFAPRDRSCVRAHTITHELGHVLGLRHYPRSHAGSVMSYLGWRGRCGRIGPHDRADYRELYPSATASS